VVLKYIREMSAKNIFQSVQPSARAKQICSSFSKQPYICQHIAKQKKYTQLLVHCEEEANSFKF
jgi:hypothetical protein